MEDLGKGSRSDGVHLLPFHPGFPHHLPGAPTGVGSGLGRGRGRQVLEGARRSGEAEEQARREGEVAETRATPRQEIDGGRDRDSETERRESEEEAPRGPGKDPGREARPEPRGRKRDGGTGGGERGPGARLEESRV